MSSFPINPSTTLSTDLYSTAVFLRDQLRKVEQRCDTGKERENKLSEDRDALISAAKWLELVEQNERSVTNELRDELAFVKAEQAQGFWPTASATGLRRKPPPPLDGLPCKFSPDVSRPSLLDRYQQSDDLQKLDPTMFSLLSVPTQSSASTTSSLRGTWQKITQLVNVRDVFASTPSSQLPESTSTESIPRVFGATAGRRINLKSPMAGPTYQGGVALKKTKAYVQKPTRKTKKPSIPSLFSKSRLLKQKKKDNLKRVKASTLKISGPYLAGPILLGENFKELSPAASSGPSFARM